jgi:hypothetical protein
MEVMEQDMKEDFLMGEERSLNETLKLELTLEAAKAATQPPARLRYERARDSVGRVLPPSSFTRLGDLQTGSVGSSSISEGTFTEL